MSLQRKGIILFLALSLGIPTAEASDLQIGTTKPDATLTVDQVVTDGKAVVTVVDAQADPVRGLGVADFTVTQAGRTAEVVSVETSSQSVELPRHLVLVLDNSYSMVERRAVKALLQGVDELLKTIRPIDDVRMIVFDDKSTVKMGGRELHVRAVKSSEPSELKDFAAKAYGGAVTAKTVLYEAMLAGLDLISEMPAGEPRFLVVFSDGEDINSAYKAEEVSKAAEGLKQYRTYAIDYMPRPEIDPFLAKFAAQSRGQVWKASSEANIVSIFQKVASTILYHYVVSYRFPPTGSLAVSPDSVTIDEILIFDAAKNDSASASGASKIGIDSQSLSLRPVVDSAYGFARWKVAITNSGGTVAELTGEGAPEAEVKVPLPSGDLKALAAGGDLAVKMELQDKKDQSLLLTAPPVKLSLAQTRASLAVSPGSVTIEKITTIDSSPMLAHVYFAQGSSEIPSQYERFSTLGETGAFDEQKLRDSLEKYRHVLNIVGKRLSADPTCKITIVGCNDATPAEKGKKGLSAQRAEAVKSYLQTVWNVSPERMSVEARNLPAMPSTTKSDEGRAENRRVEILATTPVILAPIRSTYDTSRIDSTALTLRPEVVSPYGVDRWKITGSNSTGTIAEIIQGTGAPTKETKISLDSRDLGKLATGGDIAVKMELQDVKGQSMVLAPAPVKVNFAQTSQRSAQKQGQNRVQEKYALILFAFDKDTVGPANQEIVGRIAKRIKELPDATIEIVGHTDNIGKEPYNMKLSERRAATVYKTISEALRGASKDRIRYAGVGPNSPLYDNGSPEGRAFNRTVTILVDYMSAE